MHEDILPDGTTTVADTLSQSPAMRSFYLAGGTALALHLGHRRSCDLAFLVVSPSRPCPRFLG